MTVSELVKALDLTAVEVPDPDREINGAYAGDLLSWVMGNASEGNVFVTIMTNVNVVAVATLIGMSCVVFCEGVPVPEDVRQAAVQKGVNLIASKLPTYEFCAALHGALK